ncbi:MAG: hypothetical protein HY877_06355 [Deltaproteobacteria bacterium]|nr:hypothetical protein [Deltaproteobacteria bacterium]
MSFVPAINTEAITLDIVSAEAAFADGDMGTLWANLAHLQTLVAPLDGIFTEGRNGEASPAVLLQRLLSGQGTISADDFRQSMQALRAALERARAIPPFPGAVRFGPVPKDLFAHPVNSSSYLVQVSSPPKSYVPRDYQLDIAREATKHFAKEHRGIYRLDTGLGKTPEYGFIIRQLREVLPHEYKDALIVMGSHQHEPAYKLAQTMQYMFPNEQVAFLKGGVKAEDLRGCTFVVGTYQELTQAGTVDVLKSWAGNKRILFVLDEADLVVFKGQTEEGDRTASWFRPLIDFGLFNKKGEYDARTKHRMLGASATLDRPDEIPLSTVWGPGNVFYHVPMTDGIRSGNLVPLVGKVLEMEVPPDQKLLFSEFIRVDRAGHVVVDESKVQAAAGSDYSVKTAVRAVVDHMVMGIGPIGARGKAVRRGIGFAENTTALEKLMRWQQDLFELIEIIFRIYQGLNTRHPMRAETIVEILGGREKLDLFRKELKHFLYSREWQEVQPLFEKAKRSLLAGNKNDVQVLFGRLYTLLHGEARQIKGRPLVATATWDKMDQDKTGATIPEGSPHSRYRNHFGSRAVTMAAHNNGEIDMLWSIGMLERGYDDPMSSLIVDVARTKSRRLLVQRAGRIARPPDGKNPKDHSLKPEAVYVTVTPNLEAHRIDLSVQDLARVYGTEMDPELGVLRLHPNTIGGLRWKTPDPVQLDLGGTRKVHVVLVGERTIKEVISFLQKRYGPDYDPEILAYEAGRSVNEVDNFLKGIRFPSEAQLKNYLQRWGATAETIVRIMATYYSDRAEMKTIYGSAWRQVP